MKFFTAAAAMAASASACMVDGGYGCHCLPHDFYMKQRESYLSYYSLMRSHGYELNQAPVGPQMQRSIYSFSDYIPGENPYLGRWKSTDESCWITPKDAMRMNRHPVEVADNFVSQVEDNMHVTVDVTPNEWVDPHMHDHHSSFSDKLGHLRRGMAYTAAKEAVSDMVAEPVLKETPEKKDEYEYEEEYVEPKYEEHECKEPKYGKAITIGQHTKVGDVCLDGYTPKVEYEVENEVRALNGHAPIYPPPKQYGYPAYQQPYGHYPQYPQQYGYPQQQYGHAYQQYPVQQPYGPQPQYQAYQPYGQPQYAAAQYPRGAAPHGHTQLGGHPHHPHGGHAPHATHPHPQQHSQYGHPHPYGHHQAARPQHPPQGPPPYARPGRKEKAEFAVVKTYETEGTQAQKGDTVSVHYTGTLENGSVFDTSSKRGVPFQFTIGKGEVIDCWDEALKELKVGEKATLTCPYNMAYGPAGMPPMIPPAATLTFTVELVSIDN